MKKKIIIFILSTMTLVCNVLGIEILQIRCERIKHSQVYERPGGPSARG